MVAGYRVGFDDGKGVFSCHAFSCFGSGGKITNFISPFDRFLQNSYLCGFSSWILVNTVKEIISKIRVWLSEDPGAVAVIPHSNPDGDAIGSAYALAVVLKNSGREARVITPNDYPSFLQWLKGEVDILNFLRNRQQAVEYLNSCSLLFCVDFNEAGRAGDMEGYIASFGGKKVLVDHHPSPTGFCDLEVSEPTYSSTAELVFDLVTALGLGSCIDKRAAEALYTGIMTDTGSFSYSTSRPQMYHVLASLTAHHLDTDQIHARVYDNFSAERFRLMGYCLLNKMVVLPGYRTAYIAVGREELKSFGYAPGDTEGFVNLPLSIAGIVFSAFFMEKDSLVKVSFRSRGSFPANAFSSAHFNGGGHLNAAGGELRLSLGETIEYFRELLPRYLPMLENTGG